MATCYDCIHCEVCSDAGDAGFSSLKEDVSKCKHFKDKTDIVSITILTPTDLTFAVTEKGEIHNG